MTASHNGSVRINSGAVITPSVDLPQFAHLRAKDYSTRVVHEAPPMSDAERQRQADFAVHSTAQAAAQRRGPVVVHTPEAVNALVSIRHQLAAVAAALDALADLPTEIAELRARLDILDGHGDPL
jgi:hypothetical protein